MPRFLHHSAKGVSLAVVLLRTCSLDSTYRQYPGEVTTGVTPIAQQRSHLLYLHRALLPALWCVAQVHRDGVLHSYWPRCYEPCLPQQTPLMLSRHLFSLAIHPMEHGEALDQGSQGRCPLGFGWLGLWLLCKSKHAERPCSYRRHLHEEDRTLGQPSRMGLHFHILQRSRSIERVSISHGVFLGGVRTWRYPALKAWVTTSLALLAGLDHTISQRHAVSRF